MGPVDVVFSVASDMGVRQSRIAEAMGLTRQRISTMRRQGDFMASQMCRALDAMGYTVVAVPSVHVKAGNLPKGSVPVTDWRGRGD